MKRIRIVGACLVAVFAFSAVVVSAASANTFAPEFAKCAKAAKVKVKYTSKGKEKEKEIVEGKYSDKACTTPAAEKTGKYPPYEGPEGKYERVSAEGTTFTGKSGVTTIHAVSASGKPEVITCKKDKSAGTITSNTAAKATITFEGCANEKHEACGTGGKIESGTFGWVLEYLNEAETEYGAVSGSPAAPFSCGSESFELEGDLLGTAAANGKDVTFADAVNSSGEQAKNTIYPEEPIPVGTLSTDGEAHEATVVGSEELALKGVYIVNEL